MAIGIGLVVYGKRRGYSEGVHLLHTPCAALCAGIRTGFLILPARLGMLLWNGNVA
ncbi:hypothetical protein GCM10011507_16520 [Edaphobacter acidisoli]|uniref:Uncharacterized protein n=1 Tax=Edaphobacter acidisoli TaxID=2040573 RepID=A0A916RR96_9BACT|nr:hypothetical protein GCM10011507_16520 [Edaphobacter acidisoli]